MIMPQKHEKSKEEVLEELKQKVYSDRFVLWVKIIFLALLALALLTYFYLHFN